MKLSKLLAYCVTLSRVIYVITRDFGSQKGLETQWEKSSLMQALRVSARRQSSLPGDP